MLVNDGNQIKLLNYDEKYSFTLVYIISLVILPEYTKLQGKNCFQLVVWG